MLFAIPDLFPPCPHSSLRKSLFSIVYLALLASTNGMLVLAPYHEIVRVAQPVWRQAANIHQEKLRVLLEPGLLSIDDPLLSGRNRQQLQISESPKMESPAWKTALDPKHPVYNFLIEYYGLKGSKGLKRLTRWSPSPGLLFQDHTDFIDSLEEFDELSRHSNHNPPCDATVNPCQGILLEGATQQDLGGILSSSGAMIVDDDKILFSPALLYGKGEPTTKTTSKNQTKTVGGFLWYRDLLRTTISNDPVLHCFGLHEWAMQYQPEGAPPPPSAKYQGHLPLRVPRCVINETVERRGVSCTHVDALSYFAPASYSYNSYGAPLEQKDKMRLEQPACVHVHMDLLRMLLKLHPFVDPDLFCRALQVGLEARRLDVAASPSDASSYGIEPVPIETTEGRVQYRSQQMELMKRVNPIRQEVLNAYDAFISLAFDESVQQAAMERNNERCCG